MPKYLFRKRKRIFHKERRSDKWKKLNKAFKKEVKSAKAQFYAKAVADLKNQKPGKWYSALKKITSYDQQRCQSVNVDEISHLTDQEQAEIIADKFSSIQNEFFCLFIKPPEFPVGQCKMLNNKKLFLLRKKLHQK